MRFAWNCLGPVVRHKDQSGGYHHWPKLQQSLVGWRLVLTGATGPRPKVPISQGVESSRPWNRTLAGLTIITVTKVRCKSRLSKSRKLKELHKLQIKRMKYYQPRATKTWAWEWPSSKTQTTSKECHCQDDNFSNEEQGERIARTIKIHACLVCQLKCWLGWPRVLSGLWLLLDWGQDDLDWSLSGSLSSCGRRTWRRVALLGRRR